MSSCARGPELSSPTTVTTTTTEATTATSTSTTVTSTTSDAPEPQDSDVSISTIRYDGPGNDVEAEDSEYVELQNGGGATIDLSGWTVTDLKDHTVRIPSGFFVEAGSTFRICTGPGTNDENSRYFDGRGQAIWNNSGGDEATLRNRSGEVIDTYSYSS